MPEDQSPQPYRSARLKTQLACDTCRRRKSRCDGKRPSCTHCIEAGAICHYRSTPTSLETDASVLSRLATTEGRLELLEERLLAIEAERTRNGYVREEQNHRSDTLFRIPEFHHGAGHKILQYWSRLRVKLTIPDVDVLRYLKDADNQDTRFMDILPADVVQAELPLSLASQCLRTWDETLSDLPITFVMLLRSCAFFPDRISRQDELLSNRLQNGDQVLRLCDLPLEELLIYTIAFRSLPEQADSTGCAPSEICFTLALQRLWTVHLEPDEVAVRLMLMVAHIFLYLFAKPFHALGMIQSIDPAIDRLSRRTDRLSFEAPVLLFSQVFYLLQSDILSEIDGAPSTRVPRILPTKSDAQSSSLVHDGHIAVVSAPSPDYYYFSANLWLRSYLNRILGRMFTTDQAYCQPKDVGSMITEISLEIESWYRSLPLDLQFVRDARSFRLLRPAIPTRMKELSLRYHACTFILNRPVLYFVLYQDLEHLATTPPGGVSAIAERHLDPWVLASCRDCIESAKLIILTLAQHRHQMPIPRAGPNWCDVQLLVGSYAVLLSVQTASSFSPPFRDVTEIGELLDMAEDILSGVTATSPGYLRTLEMLTNIRHNFQNSTPLTGTE
ncbi:hypothetical protein VTN77DRAFT_492 [Rasamsonia byssochlamydoides]|uniref:uncharacterized protein n=1 Tax=Rasamsonia byssochlamydoides TaxID=89139 RepID=UPI0037448843